MIRFFIIYCSRFPMYTPDGKNAEVSLQAGVDSEAAGRRVHTRHVLAVVYVLESQLSAVIPMVVVHVLSDQRVRLYCTVRVDLGQHKVDITKQISH